MARFDFTPQQLGPIEKALQFPFVDLAGVGREIATVKELSNFDAPNVSQRRLNPGRSTRRR
jgi:hypothetical protein